MGVNKITQYLFHIIMSDGWIMNPTFFISSISGSRDIADLRKYKMQTRNLQTRIEIVVTPSFLKIQT